MAADHAKPSSKKGRRRTSEYAAPSGAEPREGTRNGAPVRCASATCSCGQELLRRHMADWALPAHNLQSFEFTENFHALPLGSILLGDTGDVEACSGAPRFEPGWKRTPQLTKRGCRSPGVRQNPSQQVLHNFQVDNKQRAATIVEGDPKVKTFFELLQIFDVNLVVGVRCAKRVQEFWAQKGECTNEADGFVVCAA